MGAVMLLAFALASTASAQVGPALVPDTTNPAGDLELGVSGNFVSILFGYAGTTSFGVLGGPGVHGNWTPNEWFTTNGSAYGLNTVYSNSQNGEPSGLGGFVGLDLGVPLGEMRLGIWTTVGSLGTPKTSDQDGTTGGFTTGLALGPSLRWTGPRRRISIDAHPSLLLCSVRKDSNGVLEYECPMYDEDQVFAAWLADFAASSEYGIDWIVNDRDSLRFAMTSVAPTIGWKGRFDRVDVTVLWGSALAVVNFLQVRVDTHPLQWKHPPERTDPETTWVERPHH